MNSTTASQLTSYPLNHKIGENVKPSNVTITVLKEHLPSLSSTAKTAPEIVKTQRSSKILVLDLDETLIFSSFQLSSSADAILNVDGVPRVSVFLRPHLREFLEYATKVFSEIVVFTSSNKEYADTIISLIDPESKCIGRRFYRDSCTIVNGKCVKDLRKVTTQLSDVCLVDNSLDSFAFQLENGIPILGFRPNPRDTVLLFIMSVLSLVVRYNDLRDGIRFAKQSAIKHGRL